MNNPYKDVEVAFQDLRRQFRNKTMSRGEFIDRLKKLRLRDSQGRFWMLGAQSGQWYYFDGGAWVRADPPMPEAEKVKCSSCGLENAAGTEYCDRCGSSLEEKEAVCPHCGAKLKSPFEKCPSCSDEPGTATFAEETLFPGRERENFIFRRLNPFSFLFLSGGLGLLLGIILGIFAGASGFFPGLARSLPDFLSTLQGTLMGGIVYAALGGVLGFVLLGMIGYLEAHLFNGISAICGGIKITLEERKGEEGEGKK